MKSQKRFQLILRKKINHNVQTQNSMKKYIIAEAGKINAVTIATNMAGRGTDIKLGGNKDFVYDGKKEDEKELKRGKS